MLQLRAWDTLGGGDHDWLKARHHFAVDSQGNQAQRRGCVADRCRRPGSRRDSRGRTTHCICLVVDAMRLSRVRPWTSLGE
jgi:hypothetical protein